MKQRIRVVALVHEGGDVLFLKRNMGRIEEAPVWELPTGKIRFGEQPEEAMARTFDEYLGVAFDSLKLVDVVTFMAVAGSSRMSNLYIVYEVILPEGSKLVPTERYTAFRYVSVNGLAGLKLDEASRAVIEIEAGRAHKTDYRSVANGATVYVDGASRGNPGPAGVGYYIVGEDGHVLKQGGEFIGFATSRVAEYYALKEGCEQAIALGLKQVRFVSDSLMLVNQMKGVYPVKNIDLVPINEDIRKMLAQLEAVAFMHVKREQNVEADAQANAAIDRHFEEEEI
ncbi:reverse transcriptase-like protein [Candidatus Saccharibacteria bacterium]|nr:reverse transcriptase-like protein [Candidatus Saccharibacteria bacterium]